MNMVSRGGGGYYGSDWATGTSASLPIEASLNENNVILTSSITSSRMEVSQAYTGSTYGTIGMILMADAYFDGTYTATEQYFVFSYTVPAYPDFSADLYVRDLSDSNSILYSGYLTDSSTLFITTPVGHLIDVSVHLDAFGPPSSSTSLDYSMSVAVVPEPISSILFITGGTLLAGRRYIKGKRKA